MKQLIEQFEEKQYSTIGVKTVDKKETHRYGIVEPKESSSADRLSKIVDLIEKPKQVLPIRIWPSWVAIF